MPDAALRAVLVAGALAVAFASHPAAADDAAGGYATIRASLVKIWAFDRTGKPTESGSGIVIVSNASRSLVLTAAHVVAGSASLHVDIDGERHDIPAHVELRGPRDLALLALDRGNLRAATFAARSQSVVEGNVIAVAGYVKHDELIGVVGQQPRLLYPGTVSSRPDAGAYLELENLHVEEGLSGGPVFDPQSGDVLGIVTSRTSDQRGGFADSGALVVVPFLAANAVAFHQRDEVRTASAPVRTAAPVAVRTAAPFAVRTAAPVAVRTAAPFVLAAAPVARVPLLSALHTPPPIALLVRPAPEDGRRSFEVSDFAPHRLAYAHRGCTIVLSLALVQLAFAVPGRIDGGTPSAHLRLRVGRRVAPVAACMDVAESIPSDAAYEAAASSYDGRHVTIRFRYVPPADATSADAALFPTDVSLDADLASSPVTAHVELSDVDWDGELNVIAASNR